MTDLRKIVVCTIAIGIGLGGMVAALVLIGLAFQQLPIPEFLFAGRGTHPDAPPMLVAELAASLAQMRVLILGICVLQLMLGPALIVGAVRTWQADTAGKALLWLATKLAMLFELLKLAPLMWIYIVLWRTVREFFPGRFPRLPGIALAPEFSEAQASWLTSWFVSLLLLMLGTSVVKLVSLWFVRRSLLVELTSADSKS